MIYFLEMYPLKFLPTGHVYIDPEDDCDRIVNSILDTNYNEEFCIARDFDESFIVKLMEAGFLIMSTELSPEEDGPDGEQFYILLPKLHLIRSALFFPELHIKKSIRKKLSLYELKIDTDFDYILDKCVETHGSDWLTAPLVGILKSLRQQKDIRPRPVSFALYREGELRAGEIGVVMGRVYTSYSGFYAENNAGTVQMILMAKWLEKMGFSFLDLGMPLSYKSDLGARDISPHLFIELFRSARY